MVRIVRTTLRYSNNLKISQIICSSRALLITRKCGEMIASLNVHCHTIKIVLKKCNNT